MKTFFLRGGNESINIAVLTFNQGSYVVENLKDNKNYENIVRKSISNEPKLFVLCLQESRSDIVEKMFERHLMTKGTGQYNQIFSKKISQMKLGDLKLIIYAHPTINKLKDNKDNKCPSNKQMSGSNVQIICSGAYSCDAAGKSQKLTSIFDTFTKGFIYAGVNILGKYIIFYSVHLPSSPNKPKDRDECLMQAINQHMNKGIKIVAGDMNYRTTVNDPETTEEKKLVENFKCTHCKKDTCYVCRPGNIKCPSLQDTMENFSLSGDQLRGEKCDDTGKCTLNNIEIYENKIEFCPTCRFKEHDNTNNNGFKYDPKRFPSWCDRILYTNPDSNVKQTDYNSYPISTMSDHKAVLGLFTIS